MKKPKHKRPPPDELELWFTVGLSVAEEKIVVLAVSRTKWEAQAAGLERNEGDEKCERWEVFRLDDDLGRKIRDWFQSAGMSAEDANEAARSLADSFKERFGELREKYP